MEQKPEIMDPRRKDGQGLDFWAKALFEQGLIDEQTLTDFVAKNNNKEVLMEEQGVPQLKHYGTFRSTVEIREKLGTRKDERFIIRCSSRENAEIKRLVNTTLDEACAFAEKLPGGFEKWKVEMKEFVETKMSGTIIVNKTGRTTIEGWNGAHYLNTTNVPKYHGEFDPHDFIPKFKWKAPEGTTDLSEFQENALKAFRYIFSYLKPRPDESMYAEYGVKSDGSIYFIEANDSPVVTGDYL